MEINLEILSTLEKIGKGACADIYKYGNKALKILNESGKAMTNLQETSKLEGIKNDTFVLPEQILTGANGELVGYVLELVNGQGFIDDNIIKNIDFDTLKGAIAKVEQDLQQLSADKVVCDDLNHKNIMWDTEKGCIKIVDTDSFIINKDLTKEQIYGMNLEQFNNQIELVLGNSGNTKMQVLRNDPKFVEVQRKYIVGQMRGQNPSVTMLVDCLVNIAEEQFGRKFSSLQEIEQAIQESEIQQLKEHRASAHSKFEDEISGHGKYKNLSFEKPIMDISESNSVTNKEEISK